MDERLEKITDLDKKVNSDDLIYRYKGNIADVKFDENIRKHKKISEKLLQVKGMIIIQLVVC